MVAVRDERGTVEPTTGPETDDGGYLVPDESDHARGGQCAKVRNRFGMDQAQE